MKLELISSLNNSEQRGGAYLRVRALAIIYKKLGLEVKTHYLEEFRPKSTLKGAWLSFRFKVNIRSLLNRARILFDQTDFLHFDSLRFFNWIYPKCYKKIIYNAHNLEFESYVPRENIISATLVKEFEMKSIAKADYIFVCSDREKKIISDYNTGLGNKVFVIPNLIEKDNYKISKTKNIILFVGTLDYYPNVQALEYLTSEFYPFIDKLLFKKFRFVVAGRNPTNGLKEKLDSLGVELLENVSDLELKEILSQTYISLVPLTHGSGTRLKIIESIFSGSLVLSTALGSEGISSPLIIKSELVSFRSIFEDMIKREIKIENPSLQEFYEKFDVDYWFSKNGNRLKEFLGIS